ncbi:MAG: GAF domain-containing protein [Spirochaetales bacterium]|nr:MAG: GAF domain-containing protein [Spirochaetales bacterium]
MQSKATRKTPNEALSDRLAAILEATADLNNMLTEPERLYASLLDRLQRVVPFSSGSLQVMEDDAARIVAFLGNLDKATVMGLRFRMDPLFPNYQVVMRREAVSFVDIRTEYPHFLARQNEFSSGHIRSWLGVPMIASGSVIGMIALDRNIVDPFDGEDIRIVQGFADHAAVAIRNSQIYRELQDALSVRDALMREMHHRVKNNLQLVSSLIAIHANNVDEEATRIHLDELQVRINSISAIHERLYGRANMSAIDLDDYLRALAEEVLKSFRSPGLEVSTNFNLEAIPVDASLAVPLGLITSELIMNSLKYAFPDRSEGTVSIGLKQEDSDGELRIEDSGIGMVLGGDRPEGFGILLVQSLANQIHGTATLSSAAGSTSWTIRFPLH